MWWQKRHAWRRRTRWRTFRRRSWRVRERWGWGRAWSTSSHGTAHADPAHTHIRVECGICFGSGRTDKVTKGQIWFWKSKSKILARPRARQSFHFKKFQWAQILIFFVKIGMKLPFTYIKKQTHKYKFKISVLKTSILDPRFYFFEQKTPPKKLFFVFRLWFSFKNNGLTNVLLVGIFENAPKKVIDRKMKNKK